MLLNSPLIGLVLTGGNSSRMGRDKSRLSYHNGSQVEYLTNMLDMFTFRSFLSVKNYNHSLNYPQLKDRFEFGGPLNGILTALSEFPGFSVLVVPCDMPEVDYQLIASLIQQRDKNKPASCFLNEDNPEPLPSIWEASSLAPLSEQVKLENYSPKFFLKNNQVNLVEIDNSDRLININTPEERDQYLKNKQPVDH